MKKPERPPYIPSTYNYGDVLQEKGRKFLFLPVSDVQEKIQKMMQ